MIIWNPLLKLTTGVLYS